MRKLKTVLLTSVLALAVAALACSFSGAASPEAVANSSADLQTALAALPPGDAARGQQLFSAGLPCHVCHQDQPIGPKFPGDPPLAIRAATRRPGYSAALYLYESIVNPGAFVVAGFEDGLMPKDFGHQLSPQQLADLLAYLQTLN